MFKNFTFLLLFFVFYSSLSLLALESGQNTRIISTTPAITEIIYTLNAQDTLVGISNDCNYPSGVKNIPKIGTFLKPQLEKIVMLYPGLVIGIGNPNSPKVNQLRNLGIKTIIFETPKNFEDIHKIIITIGKLTNKIKQAELLVQNLKIELDTVLSNQKVTKKPKVLFIVWPTPLICAAKNSFINCIIEAAGAVNIVTHDKLPYPKVQPEIIFQNNPDIIILAEKNFYHKIIEHPILINLPAIKNKCIIYEINPDIFLRPGPRYINAIKILGRLLKQTDKINKNQIKNTL